MNAAAKTLMTAVLAVASAVMTGLLLADQTDPYAGYRVSQDALISQLKAPAASASALKPQG